MKKILYVSDLDGTLLNSDKVVSDFTADTINKLVSAGMIFSYATARSHATASLATKNINVSIPVVVYNGTFTLDNLSGKIYSSSTFTENESQYIFDLLTQNQIEPIVYSYIDGKEKFTFSYPKLSDEARRFLETRNGDTRRNPVKELILNELGEVFYFSCIANKESLFPTYQKLKEDFACIYSSDTYDDFQWLEILTKDTSKAKGIEKLKEILGCDYIIAFGDNLNDIPMFELADECYAVSNSDEELKKIATGIIDSNNDDAVAKFLLSHYKNDEREI